MKQYLKFFYVMFMAFALMGCNKAVLQSMGSGPMAVYHEPKWNDDTKSSLSISAGVQGTPIGEGRNVEDVQSIGGDLSVLYRFAGALHPLFLQGDFAGQGGRAKFACNQGNCWDAYEAWLLTAKGKEDVSFWFVQERILAGADFRLNSLVQLGAGLGIQLYQAGGKYEQRRFDLEDVKFARNIDEKMDWYPAAGLWLGFSLPSPEKYGIIKLESEFLIASKVSEGSMSTDLSYYHPSGFHGGASLNSELGVVLHLGKTFTF